MREWEQFSRLLLYKNRNSYINDNNHKNVRKYIKFKIMYEFLY